MENNLRILYLLLIYQMHWLVVYRTADIFNWVELVLCPLKTLVDALKQKTPKAKIKKCLFLTDFILTFIEYICLYLYVLMFSNMYEADAYWNILLLPRHIALIEHMESGSPDGTSLLSGRQIILQMYGQLWVSLALTDACQGLEKPIGRSLGWLIFSNMLWENHFDICCTCWGDKVWAPYVPGDAVL